MFSDNETTSVSLGIPIFVIAAVKMELRNIEFCASSFNSSIGSNLSNNY